MSLKNTISKKSKQAVKKTLSELLDEKRAAEYTGVSTAFLRRARCHGNTGNRTAGPPFVRLQGFGEKHGLNAGRVLYARSDLDNWLAGLERRRTI